MGLGKALMRGAVLSLVIFVSYVATIAQPDSIYRLPAGTRIKLKLDAEISSKVSSVNDTFLASISQPVMVRNTIVLAAGAIIEGRVTSVEPAGSAGRAGKLDLVFETLRLPRDEKRTIDGILLKDLHAAKSRIGILSVIGGTAAGAIFGGLTHSARGVAIGAGIGAGIGTGIAFARRGPDVRIARNEEFEIVLRKEVLLPILDY